MSFDLQMFKASLLLKCLSVLQLCGLQFIHPFSLTSIFYSSEGISPLILTMTMLFIHIFLSFLGSYLLEPMCLSALGLKVCSPLSFTLNFFVTFKRRARPWKCVLINCVSFCCPLCLLTPFLLHFAAHHWIPTGSKLLKNPKHFCLLNWRQAHLCLKKKDDKNKQKQTKREQQWHFLMRPVRITKMRVINQ